MLIKQNTRVSRVHLLGVSVARVSKSRIHESCHEALYCYQQVVTEFSIDAKISGQVTSVHSNSDSDSTFRHPQFTNTPIN